jgi:Na+-translocating ferredoxin:NAD+ oxidoreductase subunit B
MTDLYRRLQRHLDRLPIGFPATTSGVELDLLRYFFSEEEAEVVLCLGLTHARPWRIRGRFRRTHGRPIDRGRLEALLEGLWRKGSIRRSLVAPHGYSVAFLAIGMFEFHVDDLTPELMRLMHAYFDEGFGDEFFRAMLPQLRTSPHLKAIVPEHRIDTYDNMRRFVETTDQRIGVANCVCKQGEALLGRPCRQVEDIEVCIFFGESDYVERGRGRYISREQCLELLELAERRGLVLQPGNSLQPICICLCCGCCCGVLTAAKRFPKPATMFATNYFAELDAAACNGCGACVRRCQMDAISRARDGRAVVLELDRCIGCGLCVTTCRPGALRLKKKAQLTVPPRNVELLYLAILAKKAGKARMLLNLLKLATGARL